MPQPSPVFARHLQSSQIGSNIFGEARSLLSFEYFSALLSLLTFEYFSALLSISV